MKRRLKGFVSVDRFLRRGELKTPQALLLGFVITGIAIALRLSVSAAVGGEQAIFAYPAIITATLLFGARAGATTATCCLLALWYYVVPDKHSFRIADAPSAITLFIYALVGLSLVAAISTMRRAMFSYRNLAAHLEQLVETRTAERNRLWELSKEAIAIADTTGTLVGVNPAFKVLVPSAVGTLLLDLIIEEDRGIVDEAAAALDLGQRSVAFSARMRTATQGIRHVAWSVVQDGSLSYFVGRDFTIEHDCELQLLQSQKMELVGQITGGLAHDFGNALSSINMALHLVRSHGADDPKISEIIGVAEQSAELGGAMIRRLLSLSQPGEDQPRAVPLRALLDEVAPLLRQAIGQRRLDLELAGDLPDVYVEPSRFDMALLNLAINARDATRRGDVLRLEASLGEAGMVEVAVSDRGTGIDGDILSRVTEPFFTTKKPGLGTGLGLLMVRTFAEGAGGRFRIESALSDGTKATISLPVQSAIG